VGGILVAAEHARGTLSAITGELIGAAAALRDQLGGPLTIAVIGDGSAEVAAGANLWGVDKVLNIDVGTPHFDGADYEEVLFRIGNEQQPRLILLGHTVNGMAYAAALAARLGSGFASDVFRLETTDNGIVATRSFYGGKTCADLEFTGKGAVVLSLRGATFPPTTESGTAEIIPVSIDLTGLPGRIRHLDYQDAPEADIDISKADFILSVGRGIQDQDNLPRFAALAERLHATFGCSRPIVDAGWLPKPHQVGQSGKVASSCKLYLALGISGAIQHLYGMKHVETIIAVNTDPGAPIFDVATYGANVDVLEFADALERCLDASGDPP
jgi:electron transfer flavoprotein alpha subunit